MCVTTHLSKKVAYGGRGWRESGEEKAGTLNALAKLFNECEQVTFWNKPPHDRHAHVIPQLRRAKSCNVDRCGLFWPYLFIDRKQKTKANNIVTFCNVLIKPSRENVMKQGFRQTKTKLLHFY